MPYSHPTVLLVDDHEDLRDSVATLLLIEGYTVKAVADGQAALDALRAGFQPCIIILDIEMPTMDGHAFRREQLADPDLAQTPVIVYSGSVDAIQALGTLSANAYLQKPSDFPTLMALVRQHCLK
jgi:CheY-like chemotaxis protein